MGTGVSWTSLALSYSQLVNVVKREERERRRGKERRVNCIPELNTCCLFSLFLLIRSRCLSTTSWHGVIFFSFRLCSSSWTWNCSSRGGKRHSSRHLLRLFVSAPVDTGKEKGQKCSGQLVLAKFAMRSCIGHRAYWPLGESGQAALWLVRWEEKYLHLASDSKCASASSLRHWCQRYN